MKIEDILKEAFGNSFEILKKVQAGLRCKTFIVKKNNTKFIFQLYTENTIYQAQKKYKVLKTLNIREIPKAYKYFEMLAQKKNINFRGWGTFYNLYKSDITCLSFVRNLLEPESTRYRTSPCSCTVVNVCLRLDGLSGMPSFSLPCSTSG